MARWEPDARGRLVEAAMALYAERGFDQTTVADIAARAGLTERTFFRHFADKREVLFSGSSRLEDVLVGTVINAPPGTAPMDAVAAALEATSPFFAERRDFSRKRQQLITAHAELKERELIKFASLAAAISEALRTRGVPAPAASLAAEVGIAIFRSAYERWLADTKKHDLAHHVREGLGDLQTITSTPSRRVNATRAGRAKS
jgi:AcrR family transcriptional regulator